MLLCAGILGRYYTDSHNVDEDMMSITDQGGRWLEGSWGGIVQRDMCSIPSTISDIVASKNISFTLPFLMMYYKKYINYFILRIVITI